MQLYSRTFIMSLESKLWVRSENHQVSFSSCNFCYYECASETVTIARKIFKIKKNQGSGTQLMQALTSITVTSNFIIFNKTVLRLPGS